MKIKKLKNRIKKGDVVELRRSIVVWEVKHLVENFGPAGARGEFENKHYPEISFWLDAYVRKGPLPCGIVYGYGGEQDDGKKLNLKIRFQYHHHDIRIILYEKNVRKLRKKK